MNKSSTGAPSSEGVLRVPVWLDTCASVSRNDPSVSGRIDSEVQLAMVNRASAQQSVMYIVSFLMLC